MFARKDRYAAAYTHKQPSRDDELVALLGWIDAQPGAGMLIVGPQANSVSHSKLASQLVHRGASYTTWKKRDWWRAERIVALWPDDKALQRLDDAPSAKAIGALTWNLKDVLTWASGVGAVDVLGLGAPTGPVLDDVVVRGALRVLTNSVNLSTGIHHSSDWDHAVGMFRLLRSRGHSLDGSMIEAWAIANGWSAADAAEVATLAAEIGAGKAKRTRSPGSWKPSARNVEHWREVGEQDDWSPF